MLTPALAEINQLARLTLTVTPNKIGPTVASVTIGWQVKDDPAPAKRELRGHSACRKVRRNGSVETAARSFPKTGGIEFDMHRRNLKREAGCYMDNIMIADKFRAWCAVKGLALNAPNIEQSFSSFCAKVGRV